jgi:hypothetical protein
VSVCVRVKPLSILLLDPRSRNRRSNLTTTSNAPRVEKFFPNGNWYKGEWQRGAMHGRGVYRWGDGSEYIGTFAKGKVRPVFFFNFFFLIFSFLHVVKFSRFV